MIIIIEGINRTEFCYPKKKRDIDRRRFFETRGMLYRAYPDQFTRMRIREFGKVTGTEEVIVYQENAIHPQIERGTVITRDKLMADIDENKSMTPGVWDKNAWAKLTGKKAVSVFKYLPYLLVFGVALYAIMTNGGIDSLFSTSGVKP